MLSGSQCLDRSLSEFGLHAMEPLVSLIIAEPGVGQQNERASKAPKHLPRAVNLNELIARNDKRTRGPHGEEPTVGDERADVAESDAEDLGDFWQGHLVGQWRNHNRILNPILGFR